jgi:hypothetical protein
MPMDSSADGPDQLDRLADAIDAGFGDAVSSVKAVSQLGRLTSPEEKSRMLRERAEVLRGRSYDVGVGRRAG